MREAFGPLAHNVDADPRLGAIRHEPVSNRFVSVRSVCELVWSHRARYSLSAPTTGQPPMVLDLKVIGTAGSHPLHVVVGDVIVALSILPLEYPDRKRESAGAPP